MASVTKPLSGAYRVRVRRKGRYASETFLRRDDAQKWARQAETLVDQGLPPNRSSVARLHTFGDLVDLHIADMCAVGKAIGRPAVCALQWRAAVATDRAPGSPRASDHALFYIFRLHDDFSTSMIDFRRDGRITIFDTDPRFAVIICAHEAFSTHETRQPDAPLLPG